MHSAALNSVLNGHPFKTVSLTSKNNDLLQQLVLLANQSDRVELRFHGTASLTRSTAATSSPGALAKATDSTSSIDVAYDRTKLTESDMVSATPTIHNNLDEQANMVMVDLGIPPEFELQTEDLQTMVENIAHARCSGRLRNSTRPRRRQSSTSTGIGAGQTLKVHFRLARQIPDPGQNLRVPGLRVLRSRGERDRSPDNLRGRPALRRSH